MKTKKCTKCKKIKKLSNFHLDNSKRDKHRFWCKDCCYEASKRKMKRDQLMIKKYKQIVCILLS